MHPKPQSSQNPQSPNPQATNFQLLQTLIPKILTDQEVQRREIIENLIRYYPFIDRPRAGK